MLLYNWTDTRAVFSFYRDWMNAPDNDERLTMSPMCFFGPDNAPIGGLTLIYNGDPDEGLAYVQKILAAAKVPAPMNGPVEQTLIQGTLLAYTGTESTTAWPGTGQYWRNGYLKNDFSDDAIDTMMAWYAKCPMPPNRTPKVTGAPGQKQADLSFVFIESLGGAIARVGKTDTAFFWRDQLFSFTFIGIYDPGNAVWERQTRDWADGFRKAMEPHMSGAVYVNYEHGNLANWQQAYYGDNYPRLREIKMKNDPQHVYRFPQDVAQ
jgi:hypothetical protein